MRKLVGLMAVLGAAAVPSLAQASTVFVDPPGPFASGPRATVVYAAANDEDNNLTVSLDPGPAIVFSDPSVTIQNGSPERCDISPDQHTATCTPSEEWCKFVDGQRVCTPIDPVPIPFVNVSLGDLDDTLVNNAPLPDSESDANDAFPAMFVHAGPGADEMTGSSTGDFFAGGTGNDTGHSLGGDDFVTENEEVAGDDHYFTGAGHDSIFGGDGGDELRGDGGSDTIFGAAGDNTIDGGAGIDMVGYQLPSADPPPDQPGASVTLHASLPTTANGLPGQNDTILAVEDVQGTAGADTITGSAIANLLEGSAGHDSITGEEGRDVLNGSSGSDAIDAADREPDRVDCGAQPTDTATVDDLDDVVGCPEPGSGLTVVDTTPPDTQITNFALNRAKAKAKVSFTGSDSAGPVTFECRLDGGDFEACDSPETFRGLSPGRHTIHVRAVDTALNADPTPDRERFRV